MSRLASVACVAAFLLISSTASAEGLIRDRLGVGMHAGGGGIADDSDESDQSLDVGGAGVHVSYRFARHWDLELSLGGFGGEDETIRRSFGIATLAAQYHFNPTGTWQWSVLGGLGSADETVEVLSPGGDVITTREFRHNVVTLGGGVERRFGHVGVSLELRALGLERDDEDKDGAEFAGKNSPVPEKSSGGEIRLQVTYYL